MTSTWLNKMKLTRHQLITELQPDNIARRMKTTAEALAVVVVFVYSCGYELGNFIHNLNQLLSNGLQRSYPRQIHQLPGHPISVSEVQRTEQRNGAEHLRHRKAGASRVPEGLNATVHTREVVSKTRRTTQTKRQAKASSRKTSKAKATTTQT